jgi:hypothetical protein
MFTTLGITFSTAMTVASRRMSASAGAEPGAAKALVAAVSSSPVAAIMRAQPMNVLLLLFLLLDFLVVGFEN